MADRKFIESLKIEDNIFELKESCIIGYLSHYSAPKGLTCKVPCLSYPKIL